MDNLTHSLIGVTAGLAFQKLPAIKNSGSPRLVSAVLAASIIGNNFPDLDFVTHWLTDGGQLAYLLQHRGYTHTLFFAPFEALVTVGLAAWLCGIRKSEELRRSQWIWLFAIASISIGLHIGADYTNDYGVHPFAPFWPRWFYGGMIFIVEPLLLISMLPLLIFRFKAMLVRGIGVVASAVLLILIWFSGFLIAPLAALMTIIQGGMLYWQWKRPGLAQPLIGIALTLTIFATAGAKIESRVEEFIALQHPEEQITDIVRTPAPSNPFCWRVIPVSYIPMQDGMKINGGKTTPFYERLGVLSLWPSLFPPESCFRRMSNGHTAPLSNATLPSSDGFYWVGEFSGITEELPFLMASYCRFESLMRFARVPFWKKTSDGIIAGDLRYDFEPGLGFTEFAFRTEEACLRSAPNWEKPSGLLPDRHPKKPEDPRAGPS